MTTSVNSLAVGALSIAAATCLGVWLYQQRGKKEEVVSETKMPESLTTTSTQFINATVLLKTHISHNVQLIRLALPKGYKLNIPTGRHIRIRATVNGEQVSRSFTPISVNIDEGILDLLIKVYPNGAMSKFMHEIKEGENVELMGPTGRFKYTPNQWRRIGMLAGGSGITPMFQILKAVAQNAEDLTEIVLIYSNTTEEDILLKKDLEDLSNQNAKIKVLFTLTKPTGDWKGLTGRINSEMIKDNLPPPKEDAKILICGPPAFNTTMVEQLTNLQYTKDMCFLF